MSVRVYQLAKQLGLDNNEVIALLRARGLKVDSPTNTIPTIYADVLIEELRGVKNSANKVQPKDDQKKEAKEKEPIDAEVPISNESGAVGVDNPSKPEKKKTDDVVVSSNTISIKRSSQPERKSYKHNPLEDIVKASKETREKKLRENVVTKPRFDKASENIKPDVSFNGIDINEKRSFPVNLNAPVSSQKESTQYHLESNDKAVQKNFKQDGNERLTFKPFLKKIERPVKQTVLKTIAVKQPIIVRDLANQMDIKPFQLISKLMSMNVFASMNQTLDPINARNVAEKFGFSLEIKHRSETEIKPKIKQEKKQNVTENKARNLSIRPPVVCVLGHVDHGKTTLLDTIRKAQVAKGEAGGITQHVAAYQVDQAGKKITFIDTPGHAAFSKMRERGANLTDIAVLVVAADDGFMPQTDEALNFAKKANIPVIVAINKIDARGANVDHVKQQMQQRGIMSEDWGGETLCAKISALKGTNIQDLLELILLQAEMMELQADLGEPPSGVVLESQMEIGKGPTASAIIQNGTLKIGNCVVCGTSYCKVRSLINDCDKPVKEAPPAMPVKVVGWTDIPSIGDIFTFVENEKVARRIVEENIIEAKNDREALVDQNDITDIDQLFSAMSAEQDKILKIIIHADVQGSVEALEGCLLGIDSKKVKLEIIESSVGLISKGDIELASTSGATIIAFNTKFENGVQALAKNHKVRVIQHNIIYEIITQVRDAMADLLEPELHEQKLGAAEVRQIFTLKSEKIAGCMVTEGKILRDQFVRVIRKKEIIFQGKFASIKHLKDDLTEVRAGFECGIKLSGFDNFENEDIIECFEIQKIQPSL